MLAPRSGSGQPRARRDRLAGALVTSALLACALVLRLLEATSELWLDEIWTVELVRPLASPWQILLDLAHDNNHVLNSLWVLAVGPDSPAPALRALSVALGTASVAAAGLAVRGRAGSLAAMALVALSPALVNYGSEARGYAGLVFFTLAGVGLLRRELDEPSFLRRQALGAAVGLGLLSHAFMLETLAVLVAWSLAARLRAEPVPRALGAMLRTFLPALAWSGGVATCLAVATMRHGYVFGGMFPFEPARFVGGWSELLEVMFGLPASWPAWLPIALAAGGACAAALAGRRDAFVLASAGAALGIPLLLWFLAIPNTQFGRYFLVPGLFLLLLGAGAFGRAWEKGGKARRFAAAVLLAVILGQCAGLADMLRAGRGRYAEAVALMAREPPFTYGSDHGERARRIVGHYARKIGSAHVLVPRDVWCSDPPRWIIRDDPADFVPSFTICPGGDQRLYAQAASFPSWRFSGAPWAIYALAPESGGEEARPAAAPAR